MAFTQADLDNIRACIGSGVLSTKFADGREVRYQDLDAMLAAEQRITAVVAGATPGGRPRRSAPSYCSGR